MHQIIKSAEITCSSVQASSTSDLESENFVCVVCGIYLHRRKIWSRCGHLKICAKKHFIGTRDLLEMLDFKGLQEDQEEVEDEVEEQDEEEKEIRDCDENNEENITIMSTTWACSMCTYDNIAADVKCEMCGTKVASNSSATCEGTKDAFRIMMGASRGGFMASDKSITWRGNPLVKTAKIEKRNKWTNSKKAIIAPGEFSMNAPPAWAPDFKKIQIPEMTCPIVVDGFQFASKELSDCYFLTHFHSDHYAGLDKDFNAGRIYCSTTTYSLVRLKIGKMSGLIPLELEKEYCIPPVGGCEVRVTLMDANHCPGAVVLYFVLQSGSRLKRVLHTGDFRWSKDMLLSPSIKEIAHHPSNIRNLSVYLDTTYCDPSYDFPPQDKILEEITTNALSHLSKRPPKESVLFIVGAYQIGKERVFMSIANALGIKIYVDKARKKTIMQYSDWTLEDQSNISTDEISPGTVSYRYNV